MFSGGIFIYSIANSTIFTRSSIATLNERLLLVLRRFSFFLRASAPTHTTTTTSSKRYTTSLLCISERREDSARQALRAPRHSSGAPSLHAAMLMATFEHKRCSGFLTTCAKRMLWRAFKALPASQQLAFSRSAHITDARHLD